MVAILSIPHAIGERPEYERACMTTLFELLYLTGNQLMMTSFETIHIAAQFRRDTRKKVARRIIWVSIRQRDDNRVQIAVDNCRSRIRRCSVTGWHITPSLQ